MKIYTKTGDKGKTSLVYGDRVSKSDIRVEAYGTCDEANSFIGLALSHLKKSGEFENKEKVLEVFHKVQTDLFHVGAELATPTGKEVKWSLKAEDIVFLEQTIDQWDQELPQLMNFILPGGSEAGATLHIARTVVRRAERIGVEVPDINPDVISYLNRLSDFLFVAARYVNYKVGTEEPILHQ
ncbi:cob(I)yrinic acid a,c-diamide adenosyltransferase [Litchfieldia salsa]|uniref:Corrinoid adenosyltransferase n=1 Tax=Litchfieldia salsa TaxID=930152 RepID=A0A1H0WP01_9BACI|nr:cob(I)yrinic acid a,c-diamide adenosyltransferase [Litchfieldia salsa]SDP92026.1 cob(I)alamin adenosyltransferase [Litchfieldia salsa]